MHSRIPECIRNCIRECGRGGQMPEGDTPIQSISVAADASCVVVGNNAGSVFGWVPVSTAELRPAFRLQVRRDM